MQRNRFLALLTIVLLLVGPSLKAFEKTPMDNSASFTQRHQLGVRIGGWANLGDVPPTEDVEDNFRFLSDIGNGNFYFEGVGGYRLHKMMMLEFDVGMVNRGSVTFTDGLSTDLGNLIIYSIMAQLKLYPISGISGKFYPYVVFGGAIHYARNDIQFTTSYDYYDRFYNTRSETDLNLVYGGGIDFPVASSIGLDLNVRYMPIRFSDELLRIKKYDGLTITLGIKYLFKQAKKQ